MPDKLVKKKDALKASFFFDMRKNKINLSGNFKFSSLYNQIFMSTLTIPQMKTPVSKSCYLSYINRFRSEYGVYLAKSIF